MALLAVMSGLVFLEACKKHHDPTPISIVSITAGSSDLNGASSATDVPADANIVITFTTDVDAATATSDNITLTRTLDGADVPMAITASGTSVTLNPNDNLAGGIQYELSIGAGLKATNGLTLAATTRNFTVVGTYVPDGAVAHWKFEDNANDETGDYSPASAGDVVDITFVTGRNATAGKAASFNGTTSIIEVPDGPSLATTNDFAISLWVKPDTAAHHGGNFVLGIGGFHGFQIEMNKNDCKMAAQYAFGTGGSGSEDLWLDGTGNVGWQGWTYSKDLTGQGGFAAIVDQKWTHLVFTYVSSTKIGSIYLNGELVKTQDFNNWPDGDPKQSVTGLTYSPDANLGTKFALGFYNDRASTLFDWAHYSDTGANHFSGQLDDVIIYHKVITAQDVTLMYNSSK